MKKAKVLIATGIFFLAGIIFTGCAEVTTTETNEQTAEKEVYQCPMDCEDGKTYEEEGQCPLCEMDLALIDA